MATSRTAQSMVRELFASYMDNPTQLPQALPHSIPLQQRARAVSDYLAGMTDRFATREHERVSGLRVFAA
jgi:dGTPase